MMSISRPEQWRLDMGYTYQDIAELAGCSRQYARNLCLHGTAGVVRAIKVIAVSGGELDIFDFVSPEDREELITAGYWPEDRLPEEVENEFLI